MTVDKKYILNNVTYIKVTMNGEKDSVEIHYKAANSSLKPKICLDVKVTILFSDLYFCLVES